MSLLQIAACVALTALLLALNELLSSAGTPRFGGLTWIGWVALSAAAGGLALVWSARDKLRGLGIDASSSEKLSGHRVRVLTESELEELGVAKYRGPEYPHPVIFPERCIGCQACVDACPHDVLAIVDGRAKAVAPDLCMEDTACEAECPVNPKACIVINTTKEVKSRPAPVRDAADYETNVAGVYIIGDISGVPLIKNAVKEGAEVITHIASELKASPTRSEAEYDVAIVGIGPGGASAAVTAQELGLRYVALEQDKVLSTIDSYPKGKYIFFKPDSKDWTGGLRVSGLGIGKAKYAAQETYDPVSSLASASEEALRAVEAAAREAASGFLSELQQARRDQLAEPLAERIKKELAKRTADAVRTREDWAHRLPVWCEEIKHQLRAKIPGDVRETILESWHGDLSERGVVVHENESVKSVKRSDAGDFFTVSSERGDEKAPQSYRARTVVLAIGLRGAPMRMRLAGEDMKVPVNGRMEPKVLYSLSNPKEFSGQHLIVVGGGNSAVEAAVDLAAERVGNGFVPRPEGERNKVTILIRGLIAPTVKFGNKLLLYRAADEGLLDIRFGAAIKEIREGEVVLEDVRTKKELGTIPNDRIFALIGGERPDNFLKSIGIDIV